MRDFWDGNRLRGEALIEARREVAQEEFLRSLCPEDIDQLRAYLQNRSARARKKPGLRKINALLEILHGYQPLPQPTDRTLRSRAAAMNEDGRPGPSSHGLLSDNTHNAQNLKNLQNLSSENARSSLQPMTAAHMLGYLHADPPHASEMQRMEMGNAQFPRSQNMPQAPAEPILQPNFRQPPEPAYATTTPTLQIPSRHPGNLQQHRALTGPIPQQHQQMPPAFNQYQGQHDPQIMHLRPDLSQVVNPRQDNAQGHRYEAPQAEICGSIPRQLRYSPQPPDAANCANIRQCENREHEQHYDQSQRGSQSFQEPFTPRSQRYAAPRAPIQGCSQEPLKRPQPAQEPFHPTQLQKNEPRLPIYE